MGPKTILFTEQIEKVWSVIFLNICLYQMFIKIFIRHLVCHTTSSSVAVNINLNVVYHFIQNLTHRTAHNVPSCGSISTSEHIIHSSKYHSHYMQLFVISTSVPCQNNSLNIIIILKVTNWIYIYTGYRAKIE